MSNEQQRVLTAFRRIINFVQSRPQFTAADNPEGAALKDRIAGLAIVVDRLTSGAAQQIVTQQQATVLATDEPKLKEDLVDLHLASIVRVAKSLRGQVPGIGIIKMPAKNASSEKLINRSTAVADGAEIYASVLAEHALPSNAIAQLRTAIGAFKTSVDGRGSAKANGSGITRQIVEDVSAGRKIVQGLDGSISRMLYGQPAELVAWRAARRVAKSTSSGTGSAPASQPSTTPASASVIPIQASAKPAESGATVDQPVATTDQRAA